MDEHCSTHASCAPPPPPHPPYTSARPEQRWIANGGNWLPDDPPQEFRTNSCLRSFWQQPNIFPCRLLCQNCGFSCYVKTLNQGRICQTKLQLLTHFNLAIGVGVWWKGGLLLARGRVFEGHYHWPPPPPLAEKRTQSGAKKLPIPKFFQGVL